MNVKINQLDDRAINPILDGKNTLEFTCISKKTTYKYIEYGTGISVNIPKGYAGFLFPMDSVNDKDLILKNNIGIIYPESKDEIIVKFKSTDENIPNTYSIGDKIARLIIMPLAHFDYIFCKNI